MRSRLALGAGAAVMTATVALSGNTVLLFDNDFDTPNQAFGSVCAPYLDNTGINQLFGGAVVFQQRFTVEAVLVSDALYTDTLGLGGVASIGLLSELEDDVLAMTLDTQGLPFLNMTFDLAAVDAPVCGGPVGVDGPPQLQVSVIDSGASYVLGPGPGPIPGVVLDSDTVTGFEPTPTTQYVLDWTSHSVSLDVSGSTDDFVTVIFDGLKPSSEFADYMAFDNLRIGSSTDEVSVPVELQLFTVE